MRNVSLTIGLGRYGNGVSSRRISTGYSDSHEKGDEVEKFRDPERANWSIHFG